MIHHGKKADTIVVLKRKIPAAAILSIACLILYCVFNGPMNESPLTFSSLDANGDTLSVFPRLRLAFSSPIADSSIRVSFSPPVSGGYGSYLNSFHDTLTVEVMDRLEGNTKYVLTMDGPVTSSDGGIWDLAGDSIVFYTHPSEQEPNDKKSCADTIASIIYGRVSDVSDLDVFVCPRHGVRAVYLQSIDCCDTFFIEDGRGAFGVKGSMNGTDTVFISNNDTVPIFVFVRSRIRGFEGNYKLGVVEK
jgi:hypothetical protein